MWSRTAAGECSPRRIFDAPPAPASLPPAAPDALRAPRGARSAGQLARSPLHRQRLRLDEVKEVVGEETPREKSEPEGPRKSSTSCVLMRLRQTSHCVPIRASITNERDAGHREREMEQTKTAPRSSNASSAMLKDPGTNRRLASRPSPPAATPRRTQLGHSSSGDSSACSRSCSSDKKIFTSTITSRSAAHHTAPSCSGAISARREARGVASLSTSSSLSARRDTPRVCPSGPPCSMATREAPRVAPGSSWVSRHTRAAAPPCDTPGRTAAEKR